MKEKELKRLINEAIKEGWFCHGDFDKDVATDRVLNLIKNKLNVKVK